MKKIFRITCIYQYFFTLNILFDVVDRGLRHEKEIISLDTIYVVFLKKNSLRIDLSWWLVVILVKNNCREWLNVKGWEAAHQKSRLFIASNGVFQHLTLNKSLKMFIAEYILRFTIDLLYHKYNPLIMTVVDGSIFQKEIFNIIPKIERKRYTLEKYIIFTQVLQWWNYKLH